MTGTAFAILAMFLTNTNQPEIWPTLPSILPPSVGRQAGEKVERLTLSPDYINIFKKKNIARGTTDPDF